MKMPLTLILAALVSSAACTHHETPARAVERTLPYYDSADFTPKWDLADAPAAHHIRPFRLTDQQNQPFTEANLGGRIAVVDFFFTTCPAICPLMATSMGDLQQAFLNDDRVVLLSHSVTPETDTPEVLAAYAEAHGVDVSKWKLLTGPKREIYDLGRRYYFVDEDLGGARNDDDFLHTENFILIDGERRIRGIYNGLDPDSMRALIADIRVLQGDGPTS